MSMPMFLTVLTQHFFTKFAINTGHTNSETNLSTELLQNMKLSLGTLAVHVHHCQIPHLDLAPMFQKHS